MFIQACIKLSIPSPPWVWRWGKKSNGRKKENRFFEDLTLFVAPKGKIWFVQHNLTQFEPMNKLFYCFVGKKIIDFVMQRDTSRGRKSKAGGGERKSKAAQLYTPLCSSFSIPLLGVSYTNWYYYVECQISF